MTTETTTKNDALQYMRDHAPVQFFARPVSFGGFGIFHSLGDNRAACVICDLTLDECLDLIDKAKETEDDDPAMIPRWETHVNKVVLRSEIIDAERTLVDAGIDEDDVETVLRRIGHILLKEELYWNGQ